MSDAPSHLDAFVKLLTDHQSRLYAFIYSVVGDAELAREVFGETNLILWKRAAEFDLDRPFVPWAFAIARMQILAARQRGRRDRLVFGDAMLDRISARWGLIAEELPDRQQALADCLRRLPEHQRELVEQRYARGMSVQQIAQATGRTAGAMSVLLHRIRTVLGQCIEERLDPEARS